MDSQLVLFDYPIQFLQDKLHGIYRGDLIMLAASTGVGKSTVSRIIARQAIASDIPVILYSLEDEPGAFVRKAVYRLYCQNTIDPMDYRQFKNLFGDNSLFVQERLEVAKDMLKTSTKGLAMITVHEMRTPNWTINDVIDQMKIEIQQGHEFFILDHFDVCVGEQASVQAHAINELWRLVSENQIALVTFSQLSSTRNREALCPSIDDLRGSKTKVNTPTIVLSLARHNYNQYPAYEGKPTYCRILKDRDNGNLKCGIIFFKNDGYLPHYKEVDCNDSGTRIDGETTKTLSKMV